MKNELLILLGTGASTPSIPDVNDITEHLLGWRKAFEPDPTSADPLCIIRPELASPDRRTIFKFIYDELVDYWSHKIPNFEELIHVLELLDSIYPIPPHDGVVDEYRPIIGPFIEVNNDLNLSHFFGIAATEACYEILKLVKEASDEIGDNSSDHHLSDGLAILGQQAILKIFSLNYDDIPERSGIPLATGFYLNEDSPFDFDHRMVISGQEGHVHYQLHGSILFGNTGIEKERLIPRYHTRGEAASNRTSRSSPSSAQDGHQAVPLPMITGLRKADKILFEPYASYFAAFRRLAMSTNRWLIIGYGGGDKHINAILEVARERFSNDSEDDLRIAIIDHFDFDGEDELRAWIGNPIATEVERCLTWGKRDLIKYFEGSGQYISRNSFNMISSNLFISFDGTQWAFNEGLPQLIEALNM